MFVSVALVFLFNGSGLSMGSAARMGAGYMPRMLCSLMLVVSLLLFIRSFRIDSEEPFHFALRPLIVIPLSLIVFALALKPLGLVISIWLAVAIGSLADKGARLMEVVLTALFLSIFSVTCFVMALGLNFPVWPVWFS